MKLKIIWIDDSQSWVKSVEEMVNSVFENKEFKPEIIKYQNTDEAYNAIFESYVDLILVDCNLPGPDNGDQFIRKLRVNRCFAHIVFYSEDTANLTAVNQDKQFQHTTPRTDIEEILEVVSDQLYRKYSHPAFMRGVLLSEFIDLENLMEELVAQFFKEEASFFKKSIIYEGGESFSLAAKLKFISRILKAHELKTEPYLQKIADIDFTSNSFTEKILKKRNVLAHAHPVYTETTGSIKLMSNIQEVEFATEWFQNTREDIHLFKKKVKDLISLNLYEVINP